MKKLKKQIERKFLEIRGWKNWEEYDKVAERLETEINARKELINLTIKLTLKKVLGLVDNCRDYKHRIKTHTVIICLNKEELKNKIEELK